MVQGGWQTEVVEDLVDGLGGAPGEPGWSGALPFGASLPAVPVPCGSPSLAALVVGPPRATLS